MLVQHNNHKLKDSVETVNDLPTMNNELYDVRRVGDNIVFYMWTGTKWYKLSFFQLNWLR